MLIAGALLLAWSAVRRDIPSFWRRWREYAVLGALNVAIPFCLAAWAVLTVPASLAAIVMATIPLFTAPLAAIRLRKPPTPRQIAGLCVGFAGVALLVGLGPMEVTSAFLTAVCALLAAAFCYAIAGIYAARRFTGVSPVESSIGQQLATFGLLLPFAAATWPDALPSARSIGALLILAIFGTVIAYMLFFRLISSVGPTDTATVAYLIPLFGTAWGVVLLQEPVSGATFAGMGLILAGVLLVTGSRPRGRKPVPAPRTTAAD